MQMREVIETLSAAKAPKKDGKGNSYAETIRSHMPILDAMQTASLLFQDYPSLGFCAILFLVKNVPVAGLTLEDYPKGVD